MSKKSDISVEPVLPAKPTVILYTDGGCSGNPGPGGYAAILMQGHHRKEISGGYRKTTNNRMEILGVIRGLEALKKTCIVKVHTDSQYVAKAVNEGWARRWRANGWMRNKQDRAENTDLWEQLLKLLEQHTVEFIWVRGHAGNAENERADVLAVAAAKKPELLADEIYEQYLKIKEIS